jgi:hypothetical protein
MEFIKKYRIDDMPEITPETVIKLTEFDIFREVAIRIAESFDNAVVEKCIEIAKEEGITDLVLLNKHDIAAAWRKQIPVECTEEVCPECNRGVKCFTADYCPHCGQKLKWWESDC